MEKKKSNWCQGKYQPENPHKYKGDKGHIIFRSSWELKMFRYCDLAENVLKWSSESVIVNYKDPMTGSNRRYFVDVYLKHRTKDGQIKEKLIEVKPAKQCKAPARQKRKTKKYLKEVETFILNQAKWKAADKYAKKRGMDFVLFTERELGIN